MKAVHLSSILPPPQVTPAPSVSAPRGRSVKAGAGKLTSCHMFPSREVKAAPQLFNYPGCQWRRASLSPISPPASRLPPLPRGSNWAPQCTVHSVQCSSTPSSVDFVHFLLPGLENVMRQFIQISFSLAHCRH